MKNINITLENHKEIEKINEEELYNEENYENVNPLIDIYTEVDHAIVLNYKIKEILESHFKKISFRKSRDLIDIKKTIKYLLKYKNYDCDIESYLFNSKSNMDYEVNDNELPLDNLYFHYILNRIEFFSQNNKLDSNKIIIFQDKEVLSGINIVGLSEIKEEIFNTFANLENEKNILILILDNNGKNLYFNHSKFLDIFIRDLQ
ncbi:MAG: hypothetical protein N4A44_04425 [Alphaproteobacteria bacterium]|jgi:hypothetical protein|nr:hypothetical protein [Alphaproteobacteria bacterium]